MNFQMNKFFQIFIIASGKHKVKKIFYFISFAFYFLYLQNTYN